MKLIEEALTWLDTPYHHQACLKGVGVDCVNLIVAVGQEAGVLGAVVIEPYNLQWQLHSRDELLLNQLKKYGCRSVELVDPELIEPGLIVTFKYGRADSHAGITIGNGEFIHAAIDYGRVVRSPISGLFLNRLSHLFRYPTL
jgi:cell wall-associated NlpC family hydrolase